MIRIGIYNRYWNTFGGGEKHVTALAAVLASVKDAEVSLIGTEPFSIRELSNRFQADLRPCRTVLWPSGQSCDALAPLTAGYDLFVNSTYCSSLPSVARRSAYLCFFPHVLPAADEANSARSEASPRQHTGVLPVSGHYEIEPSGLCWLSGNSVVSVDISGIQTSAVRFPLHLPLENQITLVRAQHQTLGWRAENGFLEVDLSPLDLTGRSSVELFIESTVFRPADVTDSTDTRLLGTCLTLKDWAGNLGCLHSRTRSSWVSTYDVIIANSVYTAGWIKRRWNRESIVLPPVIDADLFCPPTSVSGMARDNVILSVGRFFAGSHNKKHDFLIETFKAMIDHRQLPAGWELHLVGGRHREDPSHLEYYDRLLHLAEGYPIRFFPDLSFEALLAKYKQSSLYWHAAGMHECEETSPDRFEHFGITTCEAMACGLIPVVIDRAGQREIIRDGVNGFSFSTGQELMEKTRHAISILDTPSGASLRAIARESAKRYSAAQFKATLAKATLSLLPAEETSRLRRQLQAFVAAFRIFRPRPTPQVPRDTPRGASGSHRA